MEEGCPGTSLQETLSCDGPAHEEEERPGTPPPEEAWSKAWPVARGKLREVAAPSGPSRCG